MQTIIKSVLTGSDWLQLWCSWFFLFIQTNMLIVSVDVKQFYGKFQLICIIIKNCHNWFLETEKVVVCDLTF